MKRSAPANSPTLSTTMTLNYRKTFLRSIKSFLSPRNSSTMKTPANGEKESVLRKAPR